MEKKINFNFLVVIGSKLLVLFKRLRGNFKDMQEGRGSILMLRLCGMVTVVDIAVKKVSFLVDFSNFQLHFVMRRQVIYDGYSELVLGDSVGQQVCLDFTSRLPGSVSCAHLFSFGLMVFWLNGFFCARTPR